MSTHHIGSRGSDLALWQSRTVLRELSGRAPAECVPGVVESDGSFALVRLVRPQRGDERRMKIAAKLLLHIRGSCVERCVGIFERIALLHD